MLYFVISVVFFSFKYCLYNLSFFALNYGGISVYMNFFVFITPMSSRLRQTENVINYIDAAIL